MTWKIVNEGGHKCDLPDPADFKPDAEIQCLECSRVYWIEKSFWKRNNYWGTNR